MPEVTGATVKEDEKTVAEAVGASESNGTPENGVSSTSPEKKSPEKSEAEVLLAQGKRHLFIKDYPNAVAALGDACAKLSETFGDLADECADAYFNYGRALLELAREESNVLGTGPEKADSEDDEEEEVEEDEEKSEEEDSTGTSKVKGDGEESKGESKDSEEGNTNETKKKEESPADETIDTTKEVNEEEDKEEDVDNLQLAWEVFELAKTIYERQKSHNKLAETFMRLGEVALESENYANAIDDMKRCIDIQKEILAPDNREIAETYFQLGVACSMCNEFDEAIRHFKASSEILESRIKNLEKNGAPKEETEKNPFYSVEKEVGEMKALLPEIRAKIVDMEDYKQETIRSVMATLSDQPKSSDGAGTSSSSVPAAPVANGNTPKPATDISHLVRKKRKPEEDVPSEKVTKKACTEEAEK